MGVGVCGCGCGCVWVWMWMCVGVCHSFILNCMLLGVQHTPTRTSDCVLSTTPFRLFFLILSGVGMLAGTTVGVIAGCVVSGCVGVVSGGVGVVSMAAVSCNKAIAIKSTIYSNTYLFWF